MSFYSDNRTCSFKTRLVDPISLDPNFNWEVSLAEIQYPVSWINVKSGNNKVEFTVSKRKADGETEYATYDYYVTPGAYFNIQQLNAELQRARDSWITSFPNARFSMAVNAETRMTEITGTDVRLTFVGKDVADVLGYVADDDSGWMMPNAKSESSKIARFLQDFTAIYCYSDIVSLQNVGDTRAPLLRIVPVTGKVGHVVYHSFDSPTYLKVSRTVFQSIGVELRQDSGEYVQFEYGKVVLVLHFRKSI